MAYNKPQRELSHDNEFKKMIPSKFEQETWSYINVDRISRLIRAHDLAASCCCNLSAFRSPHSTWHFDDWLWTCVKYNVHQFTINIAHTLLNNKMPTTIDSAGAKPKSQQRLTRRRIPLSCVACRIRKYGKCLSATLLKLIGPDLTFADWSATVRSHVKIALPEERAIPPNAYTQRKSRRSILHYQICVQM
jgi:hypothetical protein